MEIAIEFTYSSILWENENNLIIFLKGNFFLALVFPLIISCHGYNYGEKILDINEAAISFKNLHCIHNVNWCLHIHSYANNVVGQMGFWWFDAHTLK